MNLRLQVTMYLDNYIIRPKSLHPDVLNKKKVLFALADVLAGWEITLIRKKVCPFCRRRFRGFGIVIHLKRTSWRLMKTHPHGSDYHYAYGIYPTNPCAFMYSQLLEYLTEKYIKLRYMIEKESSDRIYLRINGSEMKLFRSATELANFIRSNPDLIIKLLDGGQG